MTDISVDPIQIINREPWTQQAPCRGKHDLFDYSAGQGTKRDAYAAALRICRECPVLAECSDFASRTETKGVVLAGAVYNDHGTPWRPRGRPAKKTPEERAAELNEKAS